MLKRNYTSDLLDLEDVIVTNVEKSSDSLFISLELPRKPHVCPDCGCETERVHDYRRQLIKDIPLDSKKKVKYFVCDMNPHFRNVSKICFPKAKIVADRYHVIRQVYWAIERVRKNEQDKLSPHFRKYFKRSRSLLAKPRSRLKPNEMNALALMFEIAPRLADAYRLKNAFLSVMHSDSSEAGREHLSEWLWSAERMEMPEFQDCIQACRNWFEEILNSMDVPWTNGYIEGCNNKTRVLKRTCYGMRNFDNFRRRILFCNP